MPSSGSTEITPEIRPLSEDERAAAFRRTEPKMPHNFALIVLAIFAVLGLGGVLGEHLLSSVGLNPASTTSSSSTVPRPVTAGAAVVAPPRASPPWAQEVGATLPAFMGITTMAGGPAPGFTLVDQSDTAVSLADQRGDAVVVTFFDSSCQDICPVVSAELRQADDDLGSEATHVVFLTVNTDPLVLSTTPAAAASAETGLRALTNWHFLTSSLGNLNTVWKAYDVAVTVAPASKLVAHNDVMYFIDAAGRLRYRATPFADENSSGQFSLSATDVARWGQGIASYTRRILGKAA